MGDMTEPATPEPPTSRFLTTYRQVEEEIRASTGRPVHGDPDLEALATGMAMDQVITITVRERLEQMRAQDGEPE